MGYFYRSCGGNLSKRQKRVCQLHRPHTSGLRHPSEANPLSVAFFVKVMVFTLSEREAAADSGSKGNYSLSPVSGGG